MGLTQSEMAEKAGISLRGYQDIEYNKHRVPRGTTLRAIAEALGVEMDKLFTDENWNRASGEELNREIIAEIVKTTLDVSRGAQALPHGIDLSSYSEAKLRLIGLLRDVSDDQVEIFVAMLERAVTTSAHNKRKSR